MNILRCCTRRGTSCTDQTTCTPQADVEAERQREREEKLNVVLEDSKQLLKWLDESKMKIKKSGEYGGRIFKEMKY